MNKVSAVWKYFKLESESSPMATCNVCNKTVLQGGNNKAALNTTHLVWHIKNKNTKNTTSALESTGKDTGATNACRHFQKERERQ